MPVFKFADVSTIQQMTLPAKSLIRVVEDHSQLSKGDPLYFCAPNNSPGATLDQANNFEYRGWHVQLKLTDDDSTVSGHANLSLDGEQKCRLVLATSRVDWVTARWALDSKARDYIDDWTSKRHTGNTDFGELREI